MSIWTDLLFLGGYVATPTGAAVLEPSEPSEPSGPAVGTAPAAAAERVVVSHLLPTATVHSMTPRLQAIDRPPQPACWVAIR
jgi:hypothetical protein